MGRKSLTTRKRQVLLGSTGWWVFRNSGRMPRLPAGLPFCCLRILPSLPGSAWPSASLASDRVAPTRQLPMAPHGNVVRAPLPLTKTAIVRHSSLTMFANRFKWGEVARDSRRCQLYLDRFTNLCSVLPQPDPDWDTPLVPQLDSDFRDWTAPSA
jgi:hypothetical protein